MPTFAAVMPLLNSPGQSSQPSNPNLRTCTACGKEMAKSARTCPHCGKTYTTMGGIFIAILIALLLGGFFVVRR